MATGSAVRRRSGLEGAGALAFELGLSGALAGTAGGILLMLWELVRSAIVGEGFFLPLRLVAGVFFGVDVLIAGPWSELVGALVHLAVSIFFGIVFALLVRRDLPYGKAFVSALLYGVAVWLVMTYAVLFADPVMRERLLVSPADWFWVHLLYGLGLSTAPALRRALFPARGAPR